MARNGSGTYSLPAGNPVVTGTVISSTWANTTLSDIATALTNSIAKDGQTTPTANLPMGGYKHTGLGAGSTAGDSLRYEQLFNSGTLSLPGNLTVSGAINTPGNLTVSGAINTAGNLTVSGAINTARGSVAMHATTMDLWAQPNIIDGTGSAVTITDIADAPQAGAVRILYPVAGTTITDGATFDVDGGANYTTAAGDALIFEAVTTSTFKVHIVKADGTAIVNFPSQTGNSGKLLKTNGTSVSWDGAGVLSTLQVTTSGSAIDFTGIPSWVKRITVMLDEVSTTGTGLVQMRLGTSSGLETSGYKGAATLTSDASSVIGYSYSSINAIAVDARATDSAGRCGAITLTLMNSSTNLWAISGNVGASASPLVCMTAGTKALAAKLDRLRIFTGDAFDVGAVNILYE